MTIPSSVELMTRVPCIAVLLVAVQTETYPTRTGVMHVCDAWAAGTSPEGTSQLSEQHSAGTRRHP